MNREWINNYQLFVLWFGKFCNTRNQRPLLLILHVHLTHVSMAVIKKTMKENVFIIKVLPHRTDVFQPLKGKGIKLNDK